MSLYKRGGVYHYDFTVFGRRYRGSSHKTDVAAARRFERDLIGKTELGLEPKDNQENSRSARSGGTVSRVG